MAGKDGEAIFEKSIFGIRGLGWETHECHIECDVKFRYNFPRKRDHTLRCKNEHTRGKAPGNPGRRYFAPKAGLDVHKKDNEIWEWKRIRN
jgi:hypothetical protein